MITLQQLKRFAPRSANLSLVDALNLTMDKYEINTPRRIRYFMAQSSVESLAFTRFVENLYYTSADRIVEVFPTRMSMAQGTKLGYAPEYLRNPEKLANFVYASRYGNGDVKSGDGYRFRGRGGLGLTFKDNYAAYSKDTYGDDRCVVEPRLLEAYEDGIKSVGWFWDKKGLNKLSDSDSFTQQTKIINGSTRTVKERLPILNLANEIF